MRNSDLILRSGAFAASRRMKARLVGLMVRDARAALLTMRFEISARNKK
jgi:hypothetical protein